MPDPAVEAAQRAASSNCYTGRGLIEAAAREALKPIRDIHRPFTRDYPGGDGRTVCAHCLGPVEWPCLTAGTAYPTEELER